MNMSFNIAHKTENEFIEKSIWSENNKIPQPYIPDKLGGFLIEFFKEVGKGVRKGVGKNVGKDLTGTIKQVFEIIKENPKIIIPEIATKTGFAERTIERYISKLKKMQNISRIGGKKMNTGKS